MLQLNVGFSHAKGTLRGMHYQEAPHQEAKFVRCTRGAIYDVIVDLRPDSPTRGQWFGAELTADNGTMLYAPEGFAHGYQTLTDDTEMYYMTSAPYAADRGERRSLRRPGVRHRMAAAGVGDFRPGPQLAGLLEADDVDETSAAHRRVRIHRPALHRAAAGARLRRPCRLEPARRARRPIGVTWHQADLLDPASAAGLVHDVAPTHLLHLAWYVVPGKLITSPENFAWATSSLELVRAVRRAAAASASSGAGPATSTTGTTATARSG